MSASVVAFDVIYGMGGSGATDLEGVSVLEVEDAFECRMQCLKKPGCVGFGYSSASAGKNCVLKGGQINFSACDDLQEAWDFYKLRKLDLGVCSWDASMEAR